LVEDQSITEATTSLARYESASVIVDSGPKKAEVLIFGGRKERTVLTGASFQTELHFTINEKDGSLKSTEANLAITRDVPTGRYGLTATFCPRAGTVLLFGGAYNSIFSTSYSDELNEFDAGLHFLH